jgi:hypothetical protein
MLCILATAVLTVGAAGVATTAQAAPTVHSKAFTLQTPAKDVTFVGEEQIPGGDWTASWTVNGETVKVAAPAGSTVIVAQTGGRSASALVRTPAQSKRGTSLKSLATAYAAAGKSVVQDAMAVGYSSAEAQALAGGVRPAFKPGDIISSPCASVTGDGGDAWGRACDVQKMMQDNGGGNWYVGDQVTGSADNSWNSLYDITGLAADVNYGSGNSIIQWQPNSTVSTGSCTTRGYSLNYNYVNVSTSSTICPDRMDPDGPSNTRFGGHWSGCDKWGSDTEGVNSVDVVSDPSNATANPGLGVTIWWADCGN